jgi:hypothetical protein
MADLFTVTAPLTRFSPSGEEVLIAEVYKHPKGLLIFDPYWHLKNADEGIHLIKGWLEGEGPWKISGHIIKVLACHGTNACLADDFSEWQTYRLSNPDEYPPQPMIDSIAVKLGAILRLTN